MVGPLIFVTTVCHAEGVARSFQRLFSHCLDFLAHVLLKYELVTWLIELATGPTAYLYTFGRWLGPA